MRSARSRSIGVVFDLQHEFHGQVVDALYQAAEGTGYDLVLGAVTPSRPEQRAIQSLIDYRCEVLILVGSSLPVSELDELASTIPVVTMARAVRSPVVDVIRTDDVVGAQLAVDHLSALGHRASPTSTVIARRAPPNGDGATGRRCAPAASRPISGSCAVG